MCNCLLGIFSPFRHELPEYKGYDITKLGRNCIFLEVIFNRGGNAGGIVGLFFDGATCNWAELPLPKDTVNMNKVYALINSFNVKAVSFFAFSSKIKNKVKKLFNKK